MMLQKPTMPLPACPTQRQEKKRKGSEQTDETVRQPAELVSNLMIAPLGTDPIRDAEIKAAWANKK
jgi:hypothetical protein